MALEFLAALDGRDAARALALVEPAASVHLLPAGVRAPAAAGGRRAIEEFVAAFPDLTVRVRSVMGTADRAVAEITVEGTQARDFWGIDNQEKHMDVDQAWIFETAGDRITGIRAYWCQNQLYRRLAVKRLDRISITAGERA